MHGLELKMYDITLALITVSRDRRPCRGLAVKSCQVDAFGHVHMGPSSMKTIHSFCQPLFLKSFLILSKVKIKKKITLRFYESGKGLGY